MSTETSEMTTTETDGTEITVTREIAASPERLYALWLDPAALTRWFGMPGYENLEAAVEARVGAPWHVTSRAPEGHTVTMKGEITALEPGRRILQAWRAVGPDGVEGNETEAEVLFEPVAGGTRVTVHHRRIRHTPEMFQHGWTHSLAQVEELALAA